MRSIGILCCAGALLCAAIGAAQAADAGNDRCTKEAQLVGKMAQTFQSSPFASQFVLVRRFAYVVGAGQFNPPAATAAALIELTNYAVLNGGQDAKATETAYLHRCEQRGPVLPSTATP